MSARGIRPSPDPYRRADPFRRPDPVRRPDPFRRTDRDDLFASAPTNQTVRYVLSARQSISRQTRSHSKSSPISFRSVGSIVGVAEFLTILLASILTGGIYHLTTESIIGPVGDFVAVGILVATFYWVFVKAHGFYEPEQLLNRDGRILSKEVPLSKLLLIWTGIFAFTALLAFIAKAGSDFSRGAELSFCLLGFPAVATTRLIVVGRIRQLLASGQLAGPQTAIIFEPGEVGDGLVFRNLRSYGYMIVKSIAVSGGGDYAEAADELIAYARKVRIDEVLILISWHRRAEIDQVLTRVRRIAAPVHLLADRQVQPFLEHAIHHVGPTLAVELRPVPLSRADRVLKRSIDIAIASMTLILLWPLLLIVAALISLDSPGPILFKQKRIGFDGRVFWIFKFRTMSVLEDDTCVKQAVMKDHRVTRLGRWLRHTSIDELPQLLNVLRGEMSLVGPRPHAEAHDDAFDVAVAHYAWRRNVKPGITGWAQVNGARGETPDVESVRRRVEYDLWYVENWSLWLDMRIMLQTVPTLLGARNAY